MSYLLRILILSLVPVGLGACWDSYLDPVGDQFGDGDGGGDADSDADSDADADADTDTDTGSDNTMPYDCDWPSNPEPGTPSTSTWASFQGIAGDQIPDINTYDQCNQPVNLYNFANLGKPILLLAMSPGSSVCWTLMEWLVGIYPDAWFEGDYPNLIENYDQGKFLIVVFLWDETAPNWAEDYYDPSIPILQGTSVPVLNQSGMPGLWALNENMIVLYDTWEGSGYAPLDYVDSL